MSTWVNACLAKCLNSVLNQKEGLVGAFSVIVKLRVIFANLRLKLKSPLCSSAWDQVDGSSSSSLMTGCHFYSLPPGSGLGSVLAGAQDAHYTGCGVTGPACHTVTTS